MSSEPVAVNPYAAGNLLDEDASDALPVTVLPDEDYRPASVPWVISRWTLVCTLAAIPSFLIGLNITKDQVLGMLAGILTFICLYIAVDLRTAQAAWRHSRTLRATLRTVYILRMAITIIFPVAVAVDMLCGMVSTTITMSAMKMLNPTLNDARLTAFFPALVTTLIQGVMLNIVLAALGLILYPIIALFSRWRRNAKARAESVATR